MTSEVFSSKKNPLSVLVICFVFPALCFCAVLKTFWSKMASEVFVSLPDFVISVLSSIILEPAVWNIKTNINTLAHVNLNIFYSINQCYTCLYLCRLLLEPHLPFQPLEELPDWSNTFICLGTHHPCLSYFSHSCPEPPTVSILISSLLIPEFDFDFRSIILY